MPLNLITDRTQADVTAVLETIRQGTTSTASMKGAYNATDFNRVNAAVNYLAQQYESLGYIVKDANGVPFSNRRVNWTVYEIPTDSDIEDYLNWVQAIRDVVPSSIDTDIYWLPDDMELANVEDANAIERSLLFVEDLIGRIPQSAFYSGELYGGEV